MKRLFVLMLTLVWVIGCAPTSGEQEWKSRTLGSSLSTAELQARTGVLVDRLAVHGIHNAQLFAGLAMAETGMAHCWSEATWACRGPFAVECDGPVIAGSGDGPCARRQGGLGIFQFDGGTYSQTLAREGNSILTVAGSVDSAVEFVVPMVINSRWIEGVDDRAGAIDWINNATIGTSEYRKWLNTVVTYYNGCRIHVCRAFESRYEHYDNSTRGIARRFDDSFWDSGRTPSPTPVPTPEPPSSTSGCENTCPHINDGECDDGGPGAEHALCRLGTDCADCGPRTSDEPSVDPATCDPIGFDACIPGNCCDEASCRGTASRGVRCCREGNQRCEQVSDCCGFMDCRSGHCELRGIGRACLANADCTSNTCRSGTCQ